MPKKTAPASLSPRPSKPVTRAELEAKRGGVLAVAPSGSTYRIRKPNLARHVEAGGLPAELRAAAMRAARDGSETLTASAIAELSPEEMRQAQEHKRAYHDRLVLATVIEPRLTLEDLGSGELDDDPVLPSIDYDWLRDVALGRADRDAQGRTLWGPEPLDRMALYRFHHGCGPECEKCLAVIGDFMVAAETSE